MRAVYRVACVGAISIALSGCSGEPSVADMKQAVAGSPLMTALAQMGSRNIAALEVDKGGCAAASGAPGFVCDLRVGYRVNGQVQYGAWGKGRFFKADGAWQFQEMR